MASDRRIVAGRNAVAEALRGRARNVALVYAAASEQRPLQTLLADAKRGGVPVELCERAELDRLAEGARHQGIIGIVGDYPYVALEGLLQEAQGGLLVALDQIQDPHNLGAIVRSAVALGAAGIVTLKDRACPVTRTVVRASAGATEHARIARVTNLARSLGQAKEAGFQVVGLAGDGQWALADLPTADTGRMLVIGSEGTGLRRLVRAQCDLLARIDLPGPIASLNASVAAGIALHACQPISVTTPAAQTPPTG